MKLTSQDSSSSSKSRTRPESSSSRIALAPANHTDEKKKKPAPAAGTDKNEISSSTEGTASQVTDHLKAQEAEKGDAKKKGIIQQAAASAEPSSSTTNKKPDHENPRSSSDFTHRSSRTRQDQQMDDAQIIDTDTVTGRPGAFAVHPPADASADENNENSHGPRESLNPSVIRRNDISALQEETLERQEETSSTVPMATTVDEDQLRRQFLNEMMVTTKVEAIPQQNDDDAKQEEDNEERESTKSTKKKFLFLISGILIILGGVVGAIVGTRSSSGDAGTGGSQTKNLEPNDDDSIPIMGSGDDDDMSMSVAPSTQYPSSAPTSFMDRFYSIIQDVSLEEALQDERSPQSLGLSWIESDVPRTQDMEVSQRIERYALAVLFFATDGGRWRTITEFLLSTHHCSWEGVLCDMESLHLTSLKLRSEVLSGSLPRELALLTALQVIDLGDNLLTGTLPTEIGRLVHLQRLEIPGRGALENRRRQPSLTHNNLTGPIPSEIGLLTNLQVLDLSGNALSGFIPLQLGFLMELTEVSLHLNPQLQGTIPNALCASTSKVQELSSDCFVNVICKCCNVCCDETGSCVDVDVTPSPSAVPSAPPTNVPSSRPSMAPTNVPSSSPSVAPTDKPSAFPTMHPTLTPSSVPTLYPTTEWPSISPSAVPSYEPSPSLAPTDIMDGLYSMVTTVSTYESLQDPQSPQIQMLEWMIAFDSIERWSAEELLQRYILGVLYYSTGGSGWTARHNFLDTTVPSCAWNRRSHLVCDNNGLVTEIDLSHDDLTGSLPRELGFLSALTSLNFESNDLTGTLPLEITWLTKLTSLDLSENHISGTLHSEFGYLSNLISLDFAENSFNGTISGQFGLLSDNLSDIDFGFNYLIGTIPYEIGWLTNLWYLSFDTNGLSGTIPPVIGSQLTGLTEINFSNNPSLYGPLPEFQASGLQYGFFEGTSLTGTIQCEFSWQYLIADCIDEVECDCCNECYLDGYGVLYCGSQHCAPYWDDDNDSFTCAEIGIDPFAC